MVVKDDIQKMRNKINVFKLDFEYTKDLVIRDKALKPINTEDEYYVCPVCNSHISDYYDYKDKFCSECGQRLDWKGLGL